MREAGEERDEESRRVEARSDVSVRERAKGARKRERERRTEWRGRVGG